MITSQQVVDIVMAALEASKSKDGKVVITVAPKFLMDVAHQLQAYEDQERSEFEPYSEERNYDGN